MDDSDWFIKTIRVFTFLVAFALLSGGVYHLSTFESKPPPADTFDYKITVFNGDGTIQAEYIDEYNPAMRSYDMPSIQVNDKLTGRTYFISGHYTIEKVWDIDK